MRTCKSPAIHRTVDCGIFHITGNYFALLFCFVPSVTKAENLTNEFSLQSSHVQSIISSPEIFWYSPRRFRRKIPFYYHFLYNCIQKGVWLVLLSANYWF